MANLTNSAKLIEKLADIDSKIGSIPAGTDIGQELSDIDDKIGTVPAGENLVDMIDDAADAASAAQTAATNAATAAAAAQSTADGAATAAANAQTYAEGVADDLSDFEDEVAQTYATKAEISSVYKFKGTVADYDHLPASGQTTGDVYNVTAAHTTAPVFPAGANLAWDGSAWDVLGGTIDLSGYATTQYVDDEIDAVEGTVTTLAGRVTTAEGKITTLEGKMTTAEGNITTLQGDMTQAQSDISGLDTRLDTAEDDIDAVEGDVSTLQGQMTTVSGKVTTLEGQMTTAQGNIQTLQGDVSDIQGDISDIQDDVSDLETAVQGLVADVPFEAKWVNVTFNSGTQASVSDNFITTSTCVSTWVATSGTPASYAYEYEVQAGSLTVKASDTESCTLRMLLVKEISA